MSRGGRRPNAGRPKGSNVFGESTKVVRIPLSRVDEVKALLLNPATRIPLFASKVPAGFPSPPEDYIESHLDLNEYLIKHPAATFVVGAIGDAMTGAGIFSGDILVVDRSLPPETGRIVIAAVDGELTVKRLHRNAHTLTLKAENPEYPDIHIKQKQDTVIWGVVTNVIHKV